LIYGHFCAGLAFKYGVHGAFGGCQASLKVDSRPIKVRLTGAFQRDNSKKIELQTHTKIFKGFKAWNAQSAGQGAPAHDPTWALWQKPVVATL
jgi:hypothetical protein